MRDYCLLFNTFNIHSAVYDQAEILRLPNLRIPTRNEAIELLTLQLDIYNATAIGAATQAVDMLVFPEYGLMPLLMIRRQSLMFTEPVPDPTNIVWNPCTDLRQGTEVLHRLSCIAREQSLYVVANIGSREDCSPENDTTCPPDGRYQYNTNVAFDPTGSLVARYRKYNLFLSEPIYNTPTTVDYAYFDTPFGRVGTFICFDICFREPSVSLIEKFGVNHIVFPTAWMNEMPYYSAVTFHQGFAIGNGVNLFGANLHFPQLDYCGSGLYGSNCTYNFRHDERSHESALLLSEVPVVPQKIVRKDVSFPDYLTQEVEFTSLVFEDEFNFVSLKSMSGVVFVCHNTLCCHLEYTRFADTDELYALGAFRGLHTFEGQYYLEICTFLKCQITNSSGCNEDATTSSTYFSFFNLTGNFTTKSVYPMVVTSGVDPSSSGWVYTGQHVISRGTSKPFVSATMFGRRFDLDDGSEEVPIGASYQHTPGRTFIATFICTCALIYHK